MPVGVAPRLEVAQREVHRPERLEGRDPLVPGAAVRGAAGDLDAEGEGTGVRGDEPPARRLGDDGDLAAVPAAQGGEGAEAAVLLADDAVQGQPALGAHARAVQGAGHGEVDGHPGLHVAGAASVQHPVRDVRREGLRLRPVRDVTDRHDVDVPLQHQRGLAVAGCRADHPVPLDPGRLAAREVGIGAQLVEVERPAVDLEPGLLEPAGDRVLQVALGVGARDAGHADQLDEGLHQLGLVDGVEHAALGGGRRRGGGVGPGHARHCMPGRPGQCRRRAATVVPQRAGGAGPLAGGAADGAGG